MNRLERIQGGAGNLLNRAGPQPDAPATEVDQKGESSESDPVGEAVTGVTAERGTFTRERGRGWLWVGWRWIGGWWVSGCCGELWQWCWVFSVAMLAHVRSIVLKLCLFVTFWVGSLGVCLPPNLMSVLCV